MPLTNRKGDCFFIYLWHTPNLTLFVCILYMCARVCACVCVCSRELTPFEEASRLNQKLKANYEARLARLTPGQAYQKTSLVCASMCACVSAGETENSYRSGPRPCISLI